MMDRITKSDLENLSTRINIVKGMPTERRNAETKRANVGHYRINYSYGGAALFQTTNDGGVVLDVFGGPCSKRELFEKMQAFLMGLGDQSNG